MIVWKHALLTGATGALGPGLAAELLASNPSGKLAVLIRPTNEPVTERFSEWLGSVQEAMDERSEPVEGWRQRIIPVGGDVRQAGLGIESAASKRLQKSTDLFVHAAADTGFRSDEQAQWDINVEGTRHAIEWTRGCGAKARYIAVSTVCTSGTRTGRIEEAFTPNPPEFVNNYERTKWEAEKLTVESGLDYAIARVSIVMGTHGTGAVYRAGAMHQMFKWFSRGMVPVMQGKTETLMDLICTETAARFIARAARSEWESGVVWHIAAGERAGTLLDLAKLSFHELLGRSVVENVERPGEPFLVDRKTFERLQSEQVTPRQRALRQAMDALSSFLPMFLHPRLYDTTNAEKLWGGPLHNPDWRTTARRVMHYLGVAHNQQQAAQATSEAA